MICPTPAELSTHRAWLSEWRSPEEMGRYIDDVMSTIDGADFFNNPHAKFLRDAWAAAEFGQKRSSELARLVAERDLWPDFEVCRSGDIERVEFVEADLLNRRRGDEYRKRKERLMSGELAPDEFLVEDSAAADREVTNNRSVGRHDPVEEWHARADHILPALCERIRLKVSKAYPRSASLLVYLNIGEWGIRQHETEAGFPTAVEPALPHFMNVWVLWKDRLYGPWSNNDHRAA